MEYYKISFVGDEKVFLSTSNKFMLMSLIKDFIRTHKHVEFYFNYGGEFDELAALLCHIARSTSKSTNTTMTLVLSHPPENRKSLAEYYDKIIVLRRAEKDAATRDRYLIDAADMVITYIPQNSEKNALFSYTREKKKKVIFFA